MEERVLILTRVPATFERLNKAFRRLKAQEVTWCIFPKTLRFEFGGFFTKYTTIMVGNTFGGSIRDTANVIHRIRQEYFNPIVGFLDDPNARSTGSLFPLQVAGCNFLINGPPERLEGEACELVRCISAEILHAYRQTELPVRQG